MTFFQLSLPTMHQTTKLEEVSTAPSTDVRTEVIPDLQDTGDPAGKFCCMLSYFIAGETGKHIIIMTFVCHFLTECCHLLQKYAVFKILFVCL